MISRLNAPGDEIAQLTPPAENSGAGKPHPPPAPSSDFFERIGLARKWQSSQRWQRRLRKQQKFDRLMCDWPVGKSSPLLWGVPAELINSKQLRVLQKEFESVRRLGSRVGKLTRLVKCSDMPNPVEVSASDALYSVHLAQIAPSTIAAAPTTQTWTRVETLFRSIDRGAQCVPMSPWVDQLLRVELPITLAHQFPDLLSFHSVAEAARQRLDRSLVQYLTEEGFPERAWWSFHRAMLASWLRSVRMLRRIGKNELSDESRRRLRLLSEQSRRASLPGGIAIMTDQDISRGGRRIERLSNLVSGADLPRRRRSSEHSSLGSSSESTGLTLMQSRWTRRAAKLAVDHSSDDCRIELWRSKQILAGRLFPNVSIGGRRLQAHGRWSVNCWHENEAIQLLDMELPLGDGIVLNRTIVLAAGDRFAYFADALSAPETQSWEYRLDVPLADTMVARPETESQELILKRGVRNVAQALPLAAPEWKAGRAASGWDVTDGRVSLHHAASGRHLYVPWFLDLDAKRTTRPRTWRPLTVAHNRAVQSADSAVGYRVRIGDDQWLFYRSFGVPKPCSILSKHLVCELFIGRIETDHAITDLVQIQ